MPDLQFFILLILTSVVSLLGIFSNILSIVIYRKNKDLKKQSTTIYLVFSCILNIVICFYLPIQIIPSLMPVNIVNCKLYLAITTAIPQLKSWTLVFCAVDRMVTVVLPQKFKFREILKYQLISILTTFIILTVLFIPCVIYYGIEINAKNQTLCSSLTSSDYQWVVYYYKYNYLLIRTVIPISIMLFCSIITAWKLYKSKTEILQVSDGRKELQFGVALVTMDICFVLFRIPLIIYIIITEHDSANRIIYDFNYSILNLIGVTNIVISFFIFLIFNKIFRSHCFRLLSCKRARI
jgi:hypothetical protein